MKLVEGNIYDVTHPRKGSFRFKVIYDMGDFAEGEIVEGEAGALLSENVKSKGETVSIRKSLASFTEFK